MTVVAGGQQILASVDVRVSQGSLTVVVGPNGAGKSTLLGALMGWVRPTEGAVQLQGTPLSTLSGRQRAALVAWLPQRAQVTDALRVDEVVMAARYRHDEGLEVRRAAALQALRSVDVEHLAHRRAATLSGGEAQRVAMAGLVAQEAQTWLLDEPANHLDPAVRSRVFAWLLAQWRSGRTLVVVLHDIDVVAAHLPDEVADEVEVVGLANGALALRSTMADDALATELSALYGVRVQALPVDGRRRFLATP